MILKADGPQQIFFTSRAEMVSEEPLVRTIDEVVKRLDLKELYACWSEKGRSFYDPAMMLKVMFFAYSDGERRSRQIAKRIRYDIRYQYFTGSLRPDFHTICRFRVKDPELLASCFIQIVRICEQMGMLDTSMVAIDGSKIKASASSRRTYKRKDIDKLKREYRKLLMEDAALDMEEMRGEGYDEQEAELEVEVSPSKEVGEKQLRDRIREAIESLEDGDSEVNLTDADARYMKTSDGGIRPALNAQLATDRNQIIAAADVDNKVDDSGHFKPMVEQVKSNVDSEIDKYLVDGGYFSNANLNYIVEEGLDVYMPTAKGNPEPEGKFSRESFAYDEKTDSYQCPAGERLTYKRERQRNGVIGRIYAASAKKCQGCLLKQRCTTRKYRELLISEVYHHEREMKDKLCSEAGRKVYRQRKIMVEPVFGNMKFNLGFGRFLLRGLKKVKGEFMLMCIAHNLKKISQYWGKLTPAMAAKTVLAERKPLFLSNLLSFLRISLTRWLNPKLQAEYV